MSVGAADFPSASRSEVVMAKTMHRESSLQRVCILWFRMTHKDLATLLFSVPNGARMSQIQARIAVAEGLTKGVADTLLLVARKGYHGLCIEFKYETEDWKQGVRRVIKTYQGPEQKAWQKAVEDQGYKYAVVRTFDQFKSLIDEYFE